MRKCYLFNSILFFLFISFYSHGQNIEIRGQIIDTESLERLPYCTIEAPKLQSGTLSNSNGEFTLIIPERNLEDSVTISSMGYESSVMTLAMLSGMADYTIRLRLKTYQLPEVTIKPKDIIVKRIGITEKRNIKYTVGNIFGGMIGIHIKNNTNASGFLTSVSFFICKEGKPNAPFRIRVLSYDAKNKSPGEDLLHDNLIVTNPNTKAGWFQVDISKYNIVFPTEGVFVMQEFIYTSDQFFYTMPITYKSTDGKEKTETHQFYGIALGNTIFPDKLTWGRSYIGDPWKQHSFKHKKEFTNSMINAEVEFELK